MQNVRRSVYNAKKTKIVCTVGPSTDKVGVLENMINAGMNVQI